MRRYRFELVNPPESYRDDYRKMVVEPASPCLVRYRRREWRKTSAPLRQAVATASAGGQSVQVVVDRDLCKGHAACMAEAPEIFRVDQEGHLELLDAHPSGELLEKVRAAERYCPNRAISLKPRQEP